MKTSNKILLALFLLPFVICFLIYGSLYAKYKNNDYITEKQLDEENHLVTRLTDFSEINIHQFKGHVTIEHGNDRSLRNEKWDKDHIAYEVKGNTLFIKTTGENHVAVTILCPSFTRLEADSVSIEVNDIKLQDVALNLGHGTNLNFNSQAETLTVDIKRHAGLDFNSRANIGLLNLTLDNHASFESAGQITQFGKVQVSDSAEVRLNGKAMKALLEKTVIVE